MRAVLIGKGSALANYLVTGAAGLLGAEIAGTLADRGAGVIGLVRRNRSLMRGDRAALPTGMWDGHAPASGRIALVAGDVRDPHLGLSAGDRAAMAAHIDGIVHCAALVGFDALPADYDAINVAGTRHVLALAAARPGIGFVQVSTAYVCGICDGLVREKEGAHGTRFANAYEASKSAGEAAVREAMTAGMPAAIARPSIIVGRAADGAIASFDAIYAAFRLLAGGRMATIPARASASLDFVAIDHAVNGIATIAERIDEAAGRAYHLVSGRPMPVPEFFGLFGEYPQFRRPALIEPEAFDAARLPPVERRFHRKVASLYASYFQRNPLFCDANARALLGRPGPAADLRLMRRQIDYAIRAGFLPGETARS